MLNMLDKTCNIERPVYSQTNLSSKSRSYETLHENLPCSLRQKSGVTNDRYGKDTVFYYYRFYLSYVSGLQEKDYVYYNSSRYRIDAINDVAGKNRLLQVDCVKVE